MALGALAGIAVLLEKAEENNLPKDMRFGGWRKLDDTKIERIINWLWTGQTPKYAHFTIALLLRIFALFLRDIILSGK